MLKTKTFYVYKTNEELDVELHAFAFKDLDTRTKELFFDAQDDIELAGLNIDILEEDEKYRCGLEDFLAYTEDADDFDEALAGLGIDGMEIDFILSGETIVGYVLPDTIDPEVTYVASFMPIAALSKILVGVPAKQISPLPLLRNRKS